MSVRSISSSRVLVNEALSIGVSKRDILWIWDLSLNSAKNNLNRVKFHSSHDFCSDDDYFSKNYSFCSSQLEFLTNYYFHIHMTNFIDRFIETACFY